MRSIVYSYTAPTKKLFETRMLAERNSIRNIPRHIAVRAKRIGEGILEVFEMPSVQKPQEYSGGRKNTMCLIVRCGKFY